MPLAQTSVVIKTRDWPDLNSFMIASLSFWGISPCIEETVKLASRIFSVNQSTFLFVLQKMTAWVIVKVSYKSHSVSNFHSSLSTATKNCLIPKINRCRQKIYTYKIEKDIIAENDRLVVRLVIVQIANCVKCPFLFFNGNETLFDTYRIWKTLN